MIKRDGEKPAPSLESAIIIGYSVGLKTILGIGSQAMSNIAGKFVGKELALYAKGAGYKISKLEDVENFFKSLDFADLKLEEHPDKIVAEISNCKLCPKRVGGYEFDGTACPWGGILVGFLEEVFGYKFSMNLNLKPDQTCTIDLYFE
jgi:predicted hydrocarbon binding protein